MLSPRKYILSFHSPPPSENLQLELKGEIWFKGTGSEISSDSPCKDDNVRFTTIPLLALSSQV